MKTSLLLLACLFFAYSSCWDKETETTCLQACYNATIYGFPEGCCGCCESGSYCAGNMIEPTCCKNDQAFCGCISNRAFCEGSFFNSSKPVDSPFGTCYTPSESEGVCCYYPSPNEWKVCPANTTCCGGVTSGINSITCCTDSETCSIDSSGLPSCVPKDPPTQTACLQACYNTSTDSFPEGCCDCCPDGSYCAGNLIEPTCCKNDQAFCGCISNRAFCEGSFFNSSKPVDSPFGTCYTPSESEGVCCYYPSPNEWKVCPANTTCCGGVISGVNSITCCTDSETCSIDSSGVPSCVPKEPPTQTECLQACYNTTTDSFPEGCCDCCPDGSYCAGNMIEPTCCKNDQAFCGCISNRAFCEGSFFNSSKSVDSPFGTCYTPSESEGVCCYYPAPNEWKVCPANTTCCGGLASGIDSITCCQSSETCTFDASGMPSCVPSSSSTATGTVVTTTSSGSTVETSTLSTTSATSGTVSGTSTGSETETTSSVTTSTSGTTDSVTTTGALTTSAPPTPGSTTGEEITTTSNTSGAHLITFSLMLVVCLIYFLL